MPLTDLTDAEKAIVFDCLKCVALGKVIPHDWEFQTLFGVTAKQVQAVVDAWPNVNDSDEVVELAINNSLNSLLGLVKEETFSKNLPHSRADVARVFARWRGTPAANYIEGLR